MRRTSVLFVGVASIAWDIFGCVFAVHRHAPSFAVAFALLIVASAITTAQATDIT